MSRHMRPIQLLLVLLGLTALTAATGLPSLGEELAKCVVNSTRNGTCVPYFANGVCAKYLPNSPLVYMPEGTDILDIEAQVVALQQEALSEGTILGAQCQAVAEAFTCLTRFISCIPNSDETLPVLPCIDICADYWSACYSVQELLFKQTIHSGGDDYGQNPVPNCAWANTTFDSTYGATPQSADVWGGRKIAAWLPTPQGLLGQLLLPVDVYNYTYANNSVIQLQCQKPNETAVFDTTQPLVVAPKVCQPPLKNQGFQCVLACPFPVLTSSEAYAIQAAYVAPGILGFVICILVLLDSVYNVLLFTGFDPKAVVAMAIKSSTASRGKGVEDSTGNSSSNAAASPGSPNAVKRQRGTQATPMRVGVLYGIVGSLLGIVYFCIGPLATLVNGQQVSCSSDTIDVLAVVSGQTLADPLSCRAQRASVFVLQWIFNLILYSSVKVLFVVDSHMRKDWSAYQIRALDYVLLIYCVGLPAVTMAVALSLDSLSSSFGTASVQVSRQAAVCEVRLSVAAEWVLVWAPFILTGVLICILNVVVYFKVKRVHDLVSTNLRSTVVKFDPLAALMNRLAILGLLTFATLVVVIAASSVYTAELQNYAPALADFVYCNILGEHCVDCSIWSKLAIPPSNGALGVQLFAESFVPFIMALFFAQTALARLMAQRSRAHAATALSAGDGGSVVGKGSLVVMSTAQESNYAAS